MYNFSVFIYSLLTIKVISEVICDCGLPAIPVNTRIDNLKSRYSESESVNYVCEFNDHTIFGDDTRICKNSSWTRSLPTCVSKGFTNWKIELDSNVTQMSHKVTQDSKDKCTKIKNYNKDLSQIFFVRLENKTDQILYLEIDFDNRDTEDFNISKVQTTSIRSCTLMRYTKHSDDTVTHLFFCQIDFDQIDEISESSELDSIDKITIVVNKNTVVVCDVRVYTELHSSIYLEYYHWCGNIEKPLYSKFEMSTNTDREFDNTYWTFFRYSCDKGFKLVGNQIVRCGVTNQWLDPFPVCIPDTSTTCELYSNDNLIGAGVSVQYERLHAFNETRFAINNSITIFACINREHVMVGDSVHICDGNGKWIGFQPFCCDIKTSSHHEIHEKTLSLFAENLQHIQSYKTDGENRCGIPSLSLHTSLTNYGSMGYGRARHQLLRSSYSNGSRLAYDCHSFTKWMYTNKSTIQCIDGVWRENQSICYIERANTILLNSIDIYNFDVYKNQFYFDNKFVVKRDDKNKRDFWNSYWKNKEENECEPTVTAKSKQMWILRFNESSLITRIKLGLKNYRELNSTVNYRLVKVFVNRKECPMVQMEPYYYYSPYSEFNCENIVNKTSDQITIKFNLSSPQLKPISLCSVILLYNEVKCGSPTKPLNSIVKIDSDTRNAIYSCESGYELRGNEIVKCGLNGRWDGDVPQCVPKSLCTKHNDLVIFENNVMVNYFNTYKTSNRDVAKHGTIAIFSCHKRNLTQFIFIGSRVRMCLLTGEWSGFLPVCKDYDTSEAIQLIEEPKHDTGMGTTTAIVLSIVFLAIISAAVAYIYHRRNYFANLSGIRSVLGNYFRFGQQ